MVVFLLCVVGLFVVGFVVVDSSTAMIGGSVSVTSITNKEDNSYCQNISGSSVAIETIEILN